MTPPRTLAAALATIRAAASDQLWSAGHFLRYGAKNAADREIAQTRISVARSALEAADWIDAVWGEHARLYEAGWRYPADPDACLAAALATELPGASPGPEALAGDAASGNFLPVTDLASGHPGGIGCRGLFQRGSE